MATEQKIGRAVNRLRFKTYVWKPVVIDGLWSYQVKERAYMMAQDVRALAGLEPMTIKQFNDGWNYFDIFQEPYRKGLVYFKKICMIDW